jgi:hypothetical protein
MRRSRRTAATLALAALLSGAGVANAAPADAFPFSPSSYTKWRWCQNGSYAYPRIQGSCWPYLLGRIG